MSFLRVIYPKKYSFLNLSCASCALFALTNLQRLQDWIILENLKFESIGHTYFRHTGFSVKTEQICVKLSLFWSFCIKCLLSYFWFSKIEQCNDYLKHNQKDLIET